MTRTIKFRAWSKREMIFGEPNYIWDMTTEEEPRMQFTGLLDKNGKEIYEGDVVQWGDPASPGKAQVVWNDKAWSYIPRIKDKFSKKKRVFEVIGNIYENPELI